MQAVILAAGKGVRMKPLTEAVPKPLLKVAGMAILDRTLSALPEEADEIIIVTGYLRDQIENHVLIHYPGKNIRLVEQTLLNGTAGAVKACEEFIRGRFLVVNGDDIYNRRDLEKLLAINFGFLIKDVSDDPAYSAGFARLGKVISDNTGRLIDITEGGEGKFLNIGAYVLDERVFRQEPVMLKNGEFGLPQTLVAMSRGGTEVKVTQASFWIPIGYPEDLKRAEQLLKEAGNA